MTGEMVFIAVGTLARHASEDGGEQLQRSQSFTFRHNAVAHGLALLSDGHWSSFVVEERYYRSAGR